MASRIQAINTYRPKLKRGCTVGFDELVAYLTGHSGVTEGQIIRVLYLLADAVVFYGQVGRGVRLPGLGTYLPNLRPDGTWNVEHRQDRELKNRLNRESHFSGTVLNKENLGKSPDELVALWNQIHPEDPVEP